ncbi:MAG: response regulator transcription factor [Mariprofundales bacterium]|nr:response regulator transcription factor [Mariprofundales bacterium]
MMPDAVDVLIVEDDEDIATMMALLLKQSHLVCRMVGDGDEAKAVLAASNCCRMVILDRMIPGISGMALLRWMRKQPHLLTLPVLMVTALGNTKERVLGLKDGADDYLPKPFDPDELRARVDALLRRVPDRVVEHGVSMEVPAGSKLRLSEDGDALFVGDRELEMRPMELGVLKWLMKKPGKVRSRDYLLDKVWGMDNFVELRTVDVTVKRLRSTLKAHGVKKCIKTVRGSGYAYREPKA